MADRGHVSPSFASVRVIILRAEEQFPQLPHVIGNRRSPRGRASQAGAENFGLLFPVELLQAASTQMKTLTSMNRIFSYRNVLRIDLCGSKLI